MPLVPKEILRKTAPQSTPILDASVKRRLEAELRVIHAQLNKIVDAIAEIQGHLK